VPVVEEAFALRPPMSQPGQRCQTGR
jgi:hypothetical protein